HPRTDRRMALRTTAECARSRTGAFEESGIDRGVERDAGHLPLTELPAAAEGGRREGNLDAVDAAVIAEPLLDDLPAGTAGHEGLLGDESRLRIDRQYDRLEAVPRQLDGVIELAG